jgi:hypothetical protein
VPRMQRSAHGIARRATPAEQREVRSTASGTRAICAIMQISGFWETRRQASMVPAWGTRASANTSGPDFT